MIKIGNKLVGENNPTYIILEIARTYNNDLSIAKEMIEFAGNLGVDAIKIQSILSSELMVSNDNTKDYVKYLDTLERTIEEHQKLSEICNNNDIHFLSTPEGFTMTNLLEKVDVPAYKISSLNLVYHEFLKYVARKNKPLILSTGMGEEFEIKKAVEIVKQINKNLILMHCSSTYPTEPINANLNNIHMLKKYTDVVGYSDHTIGISAPISAVSLGAKVIEKHYTFDRNQEGADHNVGVDFNMLTEMVRGIRDVDNMLGSHNRILCNEESESRQFKRRKLILNNNMKKGDVISSENIVCLQSKSIEGIQSGRIDSVLGKNLNNDFKKGHILEENNFE